MSLKIEKFDIKGPRLIHGVRHQDERGYFSEIFKESTFAELGLPHFVQENLSKSKKGVFRGMHWQVPPFAQGKLVTCLKGSILDFILDVRINSPTFGEHLSIALNENELSWVWVPEGFAHGFLALDDDTLVLYKVNRPWNPDSEVSAKITDNMAREIGNRAVLVSPKDAQAQSLEWIQVNKSHLLHNEQ